MYRWDKNKQTTEKNRGRFDTSAIFQFIVQAYFLYIFKKNDYITLEEGVQAKDLVVTEGVRAKNGDKVVIAYKGQLESDNSGDMDENILSDQEYGFTLGAGEVIRGFDIAIEGMSVGAKRKIVCPPHTAYGEDGIPSVIPANETISFEVELLSVCSANTWHSSLTFTFLELSTIFVSLVLLIRAEYPKICSLK